jgi:cell pole-organizing protein PopZ
MDNLQVWIYVIVGVLYLIGKARKKPQDTPKQARRNQQPTSNTSPKPVSFEELLREITEAKKPYQQPKPIQEYVDYDDEVEEEKESATTNYDYPKQEAYQKAEQSKYEAFNRLSYEDTLKLEDTDVKFGKFAAFVEDKRPSIAAEIAGDFSDPDKVKRAFIISEIFNRKYA